MIIGTIRSAEYDRIQPTDHLRPPEWDVISGFEWIFISRELSQGEEDRLDAVVADPGIRARIRNIGIGEYVGAINSGHDEFAARAAYGLGDLLAEQGDAQGARKAFELAINSGHDEYAVSAAYSFGALLTSSPSAPGTPMLRRLRRSASGTLLAMTGDAEGAREALQQAIDSGHAEFAARAKQALDELGSGGRLPTG